MKFARVLISLLALLAFGAFSASAGAAKAKPNLKVSKFTVQAGVIHPGERIVNTATVANNGRATAGKSETTFLLSSDAKRSKNDTILQFRQKVGKLKKKEGSTATTGGAIPASISAGKYFVGACADGTSKVKESKETDNCTFTKTPITVSAFPTSVNDGTPAAVAPLNTVLPSITGSPAVGRAVTAATGTWTPMGVFLLRQWLLCSDNSTIGSCAVISGAEGATYTPVAGDENKFIRLRVTATNSAGSVPATSEATAFVVPDTDADDTPDDVDCAPLDARLPGDAHPGAVNCVGRIYDASNGNGVDGAVVALDNVLITAVKNSTAYVQVKSGDPGYDIVSGPKHSGLELTGALGRSVGERVNVYGTLRATSTGWVVDAQTMAVVGSGEAPFATGITFTQFLSDGASYDGALISFPSITISSIDSAGWHLDLGGTPMIVDDTLYGTLPAAVAGQNISGLQGIGQSFDGSLKLMPRTNGDIILDPL